MKLDLRFLIQKMLSTGTPKVKGHPIFAVFAKGKEGAVKSLHEDLEDAKSALQFGDIIIRYGALERIELSYVGTTL